MVKRPASKEYRKELKEKILRIADELFMLNGVKAVKMDDIACKLGISKRTLYELYPNKEELIFETFKTNINKETEKFMHKIKGYTDTMDILAEFFKMRVRQMKKSNPSIFHEIASYPRVLAFIEDFRKQHSDSAKIFYSKCQEEGYIRSDVNLDLLRTSHQLLSDALYSSDKYSQYKPDEILRTMMALFIRSVCTDKGIKRIDKMFEES